jgi:hypothetical protein
VRREIPLFLTILFGCLMVIKFFVPHPYVAVLGERLEAWTIIVAAAAVVLGVANVARIHLHKIGRREPGHGFSYPILFGLGLMIILGTTPASIWAGLGADAGGIVEGSPFNFFYNRAYVPMQSTMFSLLAFFIASAAFRAFRVRKVEAALLAVTAVLVMIGRVPIGAAISPELTLPGSHDPQPLLTWLQDWIMTVPNLAAKRAILIGAALGAIATGLKIILGIERSAIGGD